MVGIEGLYFVIADANRARFVRVGQDNSLHTIEIVDATTVRKRGASAVADPADPFPRQLCQRVNEDFAVDLFIALVLIAPPDVLPDLIATLDEPTAACLIGSLARDLLDVPDLELWPYLRPWIHPDDGS